MKTTQTKRGREVKLYTIPEWFDIMEKYLGCYPGFAALEQAYFQSAKHKVCVSCLSQENLVFNTKRLLIQSTDHYMCQDCLDFYANKHRSESGE